MNRQIKKHSQAFTLVELLVVIGIIAVLIGIILPTLGRARESARRTQCASNMRSIGQAMLMYVNDWKQTLPLATWGSIQRPDGTTYASGYSWDEQIDRQLNGRLVQADIESSDIPPDKAHKILMCPSDEVNRYLGRGRTYAMVRARKSVGSIANRIHGTGSTLSNDANNKPNIKMDTHNRWVKITEVKNTSGTLMLGERARGGSWAGNASGAMIDNPDDLVIGDFTGNNMVAGSFLHGTGKGKAMFNFMFCDGHVEFLPYNANMGYKLDQNLNPRGVPGTTSDAWGMWTRFNND